MSRSVSRDQEHVLFRRNILVQRLTCGSQALAPTFLIVSYSLPTKQVEGVALVNQESRGKGRQLATSALKRRRFIIFWNIPSI